VSELLRDNERMANRYTAVFEQIGEWIGYAEELPGANVQEKTLEEAGRA